MMNLRMNTVRIEDDIKLDYSDVLIRPKRSTLESRKEVELHRTFSFKNGKSWTGIPIVAANMDTTGTIEVGKVLAEFDMLTCLSKHITEIPDTVSNYERNTMSLSFGMNGVDERILFWEPTTFTVPHHFFCLDVAKAFGAGADFVMLGGLLAGHDECAGDMVSDESGNLYKKFYGMSSDTAMKKYSGGVATYRAFEGKTVQVEYRGPINNTIQQILGGLRSACTYTGAKNLKQLPKCTTFVRVNRQLNTVFGNG